MTRSLAILATLLATLLAVPAAVAHRGGDDDRSHEKRAARAGTVVSVDATAGTVTISLRDAALLAAGDRVVVKARALRLRADDGDEVEVKGTLTSLLPLTVTTKNGRTVTCAVPAGFSLTGLSTGTRVEMTCDLVGSTLTLRRIHAEDEDDDAAGHHGGTSGARDEGDRSGKNGGGGHEEDDD